ncbi:extra-cytoplasmic solute receptor [Cupriavidus basilensis OR16]|uniref:Extra-cytoplasmic solute receptor n=1 Tax=Cupriavidus basilensis OR16 TaxID=1127483 RepID=H1SC57_9BURK|nr:tripartite tricarboxylate transporter substrate binding protein [Cupriavidus basilensis]EHP39835.1 extra-cytoplasmic solute receptor [Cupriavidus basilensis OR16]
MRKWIKGLSAALVTSVGFWATFCSQAVAAWPTKSIRMVVPASAGSGTDTLARAMADRLGSAIGQAIIVDNKPGASGVIGTEAVVRSEPDGYTLLYTNASFAVMAPAITSKMRYDIVRDLTPIAQVAVGGVILLVNQKLPANNLPELIALIKANPDKYSYGSWGIGSSGHLIMEYLKQQTGMKVAHIPYKTVPQLLTELTSGVLSIGWADPSSPVPFIKAKSIKALAISGDSRAPAVPELLTMREQGFPFEAVGWFGMFAPAGTPPAIVARLHDEVNRIQATTEMQTLMARLNFEPPPIASIDQFRATISKDLTVWQEIARKNNIKAEQ